MGREPRTYSIWGRIIAVDASHYVVAITAMTTDRRGQDEILGDTYTTADLEDARARRLEMVREICTRLEAQGNCISNVEVLD